MPAPLQVAIHESGHVVASLVLGLDFEYVTIVPEWEGDYDDPYIARHGHMRDHLILDEKMAANPEREILVSLCGGYAEHFFYSRSVRGGSGGDLRQVKYIRRKAKIDQRRMQLLQNKARHLVDKYQHAILRVATKLYEHKMLFPSEVLPLIPGCKTEAWL